MVEGNEEVQLPTKRSSESEPADSLRDKYNVIGGWLRSLTFFVRRNRAMWEEDPSYQNSNFRFLVGTVLCALLAGPIVALWTGDWGFYQGFLGALAAGVTVWPGA